MKEKEAEIQRLKLQLKLFEESKLKWIQKENNLHLKYCMYIRTVEEENQKLKAVKNDFSPPSSQHFHIAISTVYLKKKKNVSNSATSDKIF